MSLKFEPLLPCTEKLKKRRRRFPSGCASSATGNAATGNNDALMFVVDGEIWQMKRWAEIEERITPLSFDAWCLQYNGKAL